MPPGKTETPRKNFSVDEDPDGADTQAASATAVIDETNVEPTPQPTAKVKPAPVEVVPTPAPATEPGVIATPPPARKSNVVNGVHECGLPVVLVSGSGKDSKKKLVGYVNQYGYGPEHRKALEYTEHERKLYEDYRKASHTYGTAPKEFFVAAVRLFKAGFPLVKTGATDLNDMKITG